MDCWIASFPRSGNTYFRNILYYVYGIESSTWHKETVYPVDENYESYRFVKTHLLPGDLIPDDPNIPAIYLVRDGRDAVVSIAHHRSDLVMPGSDFNLNLQEAILAGEGSFFGGWSKNAEEWFQRANLIIRFEDLISDPVSVFKRVEKLITLPTANWNNLPSFKELKSGKPKYGGISKIADPKFNPDEFAEKFFRKGKSGGWKEEMSPFFQDLFWSFHGDTMERLGYAANSGSVGQNPTLDYNVMLKMGIEVPKIENEIFRIFIEASKLTEPVNDGIKRYLFNLLKKFEDITLYGDPRWEFKLLIGQIIYPLESYRKGINIEQVETLYLYEKVLMGFKSILKSTLPEKVYNAISRFYKKTNVRNVLRFIQFKTTSTKNKLQNKKIFSIKDIADILHIPLPQNAVQYKTLDQTIVITVHDLTHKLFPDYHDKDNVAMSEAGMKLILDKDVYVIGVSKNTIDDLMSHYSIPNKIIHLVYEAADNDLFKMNVNIEPGKIVREKYKLGDNPYFLCLSTIEPRKNLPNTIRAFNKFCDENSNTKINLVISGRYGWKTEHLDEELHLDNPRIIFTDYVDDNDLPILYSEAVALCYVSFYEGFGLPPLEAMMCRSPVIYGNNSSMKEVIGEAGLPAMADNINNIKEQMQKIHFDKELREQYAQRSLHRSFEFSWRKCIYDTLKVYEGIIKNN